AASNQTTIKLTYNKAIQCSTVDVVGGTDYSVTAGSTAASVLNASCSGPTSDTVTLTLAPGADMSQVITVTAKAGADGDTVKDPARSQQKVGNDDAAGDAPNSVTASTATGSPDP